MRIEGTSKGLREGFLHLSTGVRGRSRRRGDDGVHRAANEAVRESLLSHLLVSFSSAMLVILIIIFRVPVLEPLEQQQLKTFSS